MSAADGMIIWTGDYLADTQHFSCAQHGAYLLILMAMWRNGGYLANDEARLARIVKLPANKWRVIAPAVMELMTIESDRFTQKRLLSVLKTTLERIEKRRLSGKSGGDAKALKSQDARLASASELPQQSPTDAGGTRTEDLDLRKKDAPSAPLFENASRETSDEADLFARGKKVLGTGAGGLIAGLLKSKKGNVALARAAIEQASTKQNPREYIGAIVRPPPDVRHTAKDQYEGIV